jgi:hypothetical protein
MTSASSERAAAARAKRGEAAHARRLAATFPLEADRQPLLHYAEELERQAEALERQEPLATRPGLVEQQQPEQQPQDKRPPPRKPD